MKHFFSFLFFATLIACNSSSKPKLLRVGVAASAQYVLEDLVTYYNKNTKIEIELVVSSSGKLTTQIENEAPIDIFISADVKYPQYLVDKGFAVQNHLDIYGEGKLILWTTLDLEIEAGLALLEKEEIHKIAIADAISAPYGDLSIQMLKKEALYDKIKEKIVLGENIGQVNQYVQTKAVEVGITAKSVLFNPVLKDKGHFFELPSYTLKQGMVLLKEKKEAKAFYNFLLSKEAKPIFEKHGYRISSS